MKEYQKKNAKILFNSIDSHVVIIANLEIMAIETAGFKAIERWDRSGYFYKRGDLELNKAEAHDTLVDGQGD